MLMSMTWCRLPGAAAGGLRAAGSRSRPAVCRGDRAQPGQLARQDGQQARGGGTARSRRRPTGTTRRRPPRRGSPRRDGRRAGPAVGPGAPRHPRLLQRRLPCRGAGQGIPRRAAGPDGRTRAKLRLEYLLAFRHVELPSPACRSVLLAISVGDTRRQRESGAGQHLLDRATCATLSEPLDRRSVALTTIAIPGALAAWAAGKARAHPVHAAVSVAAGSAAIAAAAVLGTQLASPAPAAPAHVRVVKCACSAGPRGGHQPPVRGRARRQRCRGAAVTSPPHRYDRDRLGRHRRGRGDKERVLDRVVPGPHLGPAHRTAAAASDPGRRPGPFHRHPHRRPPSYPAQAGLRGSDAALLARQGAHLAVSTTRIWVQH